MIFLYKVTNKVNNKFYIGVHQGESDDAYMGSGRAILSAIKKYGLENFERTILYEFENIDDAYAMERKIVNVDLVNSEKCYNLTLGGKGGWHHNIKFGKENVMSRPEVRAKVSESIKKSITDDERIRRSERMKINRANGTVKSPKGLKHSIESKKKISQANTGKVAWNKDLKTGPESEAVKEKKSISSKIRAKNMDMGALTRGKIRSPKVSCINCQKTMYANKFEQYHVRGKCWLQK